ncbi:MAG TPA: imidazolonepropionase [Myxococcales bacterium]|nr:imidazolonepropionase [Myxococcales bacterium]
MLVVKHARVATMTGAQALAGDEPLGLIEDGAVACSEGRIVYVGTAAGAPAGEVIDAGGALLTPGFVDAHTHLVFAGDRAQEHALRLSGVSYLEIARRGGGIRSTVRATRAASDAELLDGAVSRLRRMLDCGVTTAEVKTGYGLSGAEELRMLRIALQAGAASGCEVIPTLLGLHAVPEEASREEWLATAVELLPEAVRLGARGCDAFCEQGAFTQAECTTFLRRGLELGLTAHLHADQLSDSGGAALAASLGCASADHLERASSEGLAAMARAGTAAVLLPLAAWFLRDTPAKAQAFLEAGVTVALASNLNPGSQRIESVSMLLAAGCLFCGLTPAQALWACTAGGARVLRLSDRGVLAAGKRADLVLFDTSDPAHLPYHAGVEHARMVIAAGKTVLVREKACS